MSSLKPREMRLLEDLFSMSGGYVLTFSNEFFESLFRRAVGIEIYTDKYGFNGNSKAKRLRAFWEVGQDSEVGKVLAEMLDVWEYENPQNNTGERDSRYGEARSIVTRLLGEENIQTDPVTLFLNKNFGNISIKKVPIDTKLLSILEYRLAEADRCMAHECPLSVIFLCGSILEGLLLGTALQKQKVFNQARSCPKDDVGKVKQFHKWTLSQLIDVACETKLLNLDVKKFSHALRDFRNYIHPNEQIASQFAPDMHTAQICLQVLKAAIASLCGERN